MHMKMKMQPLLVCVLGLLLLLMLGTGCGSHVATELSIVIQEEKSFYYLDEAMYFTVSFYNEGGRGATENVTKKADVQIERDTTGTATITKSGDHYCLTATSAGYVSVGASYNDKHVAVGVQFVDKAEELDKFAVSISASHSSSYVGDSLTLQLQGNSDMFPIRQSEVRYELSDNTANARLLEGDHLTADNAGSVKVTASYELEGRTYTAQKSFTFRGHSVRISTENTDVYVGHTVPLTAMSEDIATFDPSKLQYRVLEGDATITGSELVVNQPGTVTVQATYMLDGVEIKSNALTLTVSYDGNTIATPEHLLQLNDSGETFDLVADLDLSAYANWTPIRNFTGTLRGHGHTITGLSIQASHLESYKGLFATLGGRVEDLTLEGRITTKGEVQFIGLLCGKNTGTITNVTVAGSITAPYCDYVGGIAGWTDNSYVTGCTNKAAIQGQTYVGGLAGQMTAIRSGDVPVRNNTNAGVVTGESMVGGLAGLFKLHGDNIDTTVLVQSCTNEGAVNATKNCVGGLFGQAEGEYHNNGEIVGSYWYHEYMAQLSITTCYNRAEVSGCDYVGGILGYGSAYVSEISFCENTGDITGNLYVGGYAGRSTGTAMRNLSNSNTITGKAYVGGIGGYVGVVERCDNSGTLSIVGHYVREDNVSVSWVGGIAGLAYGAMGCTNHADIILPDAGTAVGGIAGVLHALRSGDESLFADNRNNGNITSNSSHVGGVFGELSVQGSDCDVTLLIKDNTNSGAVVGTNYVGGVIGHAVGEYHNNGEIVGSYWYHEYTAQVKFASCENTATVNGSDRVGGILGYGSSYIAELAFCENTGDITGNLYVGGYVGQANNTTLRNLTNSNTITGKAYVGGVAGWAGKVEKCANNGILTIEGCYVAGDNVARSYVGGIAGFATSANNCTNNVDITLAGAGACVGGIVGGMNVTRSSDEGLFADNSNYGTITSDSTHVGGIFGDLSVQGSDADVTILLKNNTNNGAVVGTKYVGGLFGHVAGEYHNNGEISGSYWYREYTAYVKLMNNINDADVTGTDYVGGILGKGAQYIIADEYAWSTNSFTGTLTAEGERRGDLYGHIA